MVSPRTNDGQCSGRICGLKAKGSDDVCMLDRHRIDNFQKRLLQSVNLSQMRSGFVWMSSTHAPFVRFAGLEHFNRDHVRVFPTALIPRGVNVCIRTVVAVISGVCVRAGNVYIRDDALVRQHTDLVR